MTLHRVRQTFERSMARPGVSRFFERRCWFRPCEIRAKSILASVIAVLPVSARQVSHASSDRAGSCDCLAVRAMRSPNPTPSARAHLAARPAASGDTQPCASRRACRPNRTPLHGGATQTVNQPYSATPLGETCAASGIERVAGQRASSCAAPAPQRLALCRSGRWSHES